MVELDKGESIVDKSFPELAEIAKEEGVPTSKVIDKAVKLYVTARQAKEEPGTKLYLELPGGEKKEIILDLIE